MLAGRTLADTVRNVFVVILMVVVGYIIGFRFQDGILPALAAMGLAVLWGHALQWIAAFLGLVIKDPETAQVSGFVWLFPLVFASSVFVPTSNMPSGLRFFAEHQPVTRVVNSVRALTLGTPADDLWIALAWIAGILVIFVPLSIWQYRRSTGT
jgi:ABC-2 type transport system permease protein/oleandomycin transport system permease protein